MKRGLGAWVVPSKVTDRSCIASSRAAWVFGGVRLISSASSSSQNSGPLVRWKVLGWKLELFALMMSHGISAGVISIRKYSSASAVARQREISVLAVRGGASSKI